MLRQISICADEAELLLVFCGPQWTSRGVDGPAAQMYCGVRPTIWSSLSVQRNFECVHCLMKDQCVKCSWFDCLPIRAIYLTLFWLYCVLEPRFGAVFKDQSIMCLCIDQLCMTFERKSRRSDQWQFITLCFTLASWIVGIFVIPFRLPVLHRLVPAWSGGCWYCMLVVGKGYFLWPVEKGCLTKSMFPVSAHGRHEHEKVPPFLSY